MPFTGVTGCCGADIVKMVNQVDRGNWRSARVTSNAIVRVPEPNRSTVVRDMQDWLVELRAERAKALARQDCAKAEELQVEIAQVLACIDAVSESATAI